MSEFNAASDTIWVISEAPAHVTPSTKTRSQHKIETCILLELCVCCT